VLDNHRLNLEARDISVRRKRSPEVRMRADPDMLTTAIDNLVSNALKFSPAHGSIAIGVEKRGNRAHILVADQGPGVPAQDRSRLFEPFYRGSGRHSRSRPGSGLGLAICRDIVRAHQGSVRLIDSANWSTVVVIELPIASSGDARQ